MNGKLEGVFEHDYQESLNKFKEQLPEHLGILLEDTIAWLAWEPSEVNAIGNDFYVWKKPNTMNCPPCYVLMRHDKEKGQLVFCAFYDREFVAAKTED